jgi:hypothetical protein
VVPMDATRLPIDPKNGRLLPTLRGGLCAAWMAWAACAVAEALIAFYDVESVIVTGPVIALLGLTTVILGFAGRYMALACLGLANILVCILFFLLVVILEWGPRDAQHPFAVMGAIYTAATLPVAVWVTRRVPRPVNPWACVHCGYLLYGLRDPRCPECGTPFDPSLLRASAGRTGSPGGRPECGVS